MKQEANDDKLSETESVTNLESESEKSLNLSSIDSQLESEEDDQQSQLVKDYHEAPIEVKISTNILKESQR